MFFTSKCNQENSLPLKKQLISFSIISFPPPLVSNEYANDIGEQAYHIAESCYIVGETSHLVDSITW